MFERSSDGARRSVVMAQEEARAHHTSPIGVDHLLLAILRLHDDAVRRTLSCLTGSVSELYDAVDAQIPTGPMRPDGPIPFDQPVKDVMIRAFQEAGSRKDEHIGNEHLLLAIASVGETVARTALHEQGATREAMLAALGSEAAPGFQVRTTRGLGRFRRGGGTGAG